MRRSRKVAHVKTNLGYQFLAGAILHSGYLAQPCNDIFVGREDLLDMPVHLRDFLREPSVA